MFLIYYVCFFPYKLYTILSCSPSLEGGDAPGIRIKFVAGKNKKIHNKNLPGLRFVHYEPNMEWSRLELRFPEE